MASLKTCPTCGKPLPPNTPEGICPWCVFGEALRSPRSTAERANETTAGDIGNARSMTPPALPREFGDYELIEELGRGGMGVVLKARQRSLDRIVAVKLLLHGRWEEPAFARRFRLEAEAAAQLEHANIVSIHEFGEHDDQPYYAMRFVDGHSLDHELANGPIAPARAAQLMVTIARAVHFAHQHGVLHRDLKPHNVIIDTAGEPHLTDFGLAKLLEHESGVTQGDAVLGSPSFMAPEQAAPGKAALTTAVDVYSLGAMLFMLLIGRAPFCGATPVDTLRHVIEDAPPQLRKLNPALPRDLETICLKCLQKEPARRYGSAEAFADDLERWLRCEPIAARRVGTLERTWLWARRQPVRGGLVAALLLAVSVGVAGVAWQGRRADRERRSAVEATSIALAQERKAEAARSQAQRLIGFMMQELAPDMRDHGRLQSQKLTVEATVRYFDQLPAALRDETTVRDHAAALEALADTYGQKLNTFTLAAENIDIARDAAQRALALRRQIAAAHPNDPEAVAGAGWAEIRLFFNTITDPTTWPQVESKGLDYIQRFRALEQRFPESQAVQRLLASVLRDWTAWVEFDPPAETHRAASEARERWGRLLAATPDDPDVRIGYARCLPIVAQTLAAIGEPDRAIETAEEGLAYATHLLETDPNNLRFLFAAAEAARWRAQLHPIGAPARAWEAERIAREHYRKLMALDPAAVEWRARYASMFREEIRVLDAAGRLPEARAGAREIIELLRPVARDRLAEDLLAKWLIRAAVLASKAGDAADAQNQVAAVGEFGRVRALTFPENSWERCAEQLFWLMERCDGFEKLEDWPELERAAGEALSEIASALGTFRGREPDVIAQRAAGQYHLGRALLAQGRTAEAVANLEPAVADFRTTSSWGLLGDGKKRAARAENLLARARVLASQAPPED